MPLKNTLIIALLLCITYSMQAQCTAENNITIPDTLEPYNEKEEPQTLIVETIGIRDIKLLIYNRWGTKVFESNSSIVGSSDEKSKAVDTGWDGTSLGEDLAPGLYVYSIEGECLDRSLVRKNGTIILTINKGEE